MKSLPPHRRRFLLLLLPAVLLTGVSAVYFARYLFKPTTGLVVNYPEVVERKGRIVFAPKTPFSPAAAAGLQAERDQVLSVAGRPIQSIRDVVEVEAGIRGFQPVPVQVLRDGEEQLTLSITPVLPLTRPDWVFALLFCAALGFMAFYLIRELPQDAASNLISLGALFYLVFTALKPFYYESLFVNLLIHLGKLTPWFMVFFAMYFPQPKGSRAGRRAVILGILGLYLVFIGVRLILFAHWQDGLGDLWYQRYRLLGRWQNLTDGVALLAYAGLLVFSYVKTQRPAERRQLEWILAGFLLGMPPYFFLDQLPMILGEPPGLRISLGGFASLFLVFVPVFFLIGLLRHKAFNLRYFLLRYLLYALLALLIFAFFYLLYQPAESLFRQAYGLPPPASGFLVTALLFFLLVPIRALLASLLERLFFPDHFRQGVRYSAGLEARNLELRILVDELNRRRRRSFQMDRLHDMKMVLAGIERRVLRDVDEASAGVAEMGPAGGQAAERARLSLFELREFARKLGGLSGLRSGTPAEVGAEYLCRSAAAELRKRYPLAEVRLSGGALQKLHCRPEELVQSLRYLLENAVEAGASPQEPVSVRISERGRAVRIEVEDHGPGFARPREAFRPFFTTKPGHDGLGLYFCRALVERNGGTVVLADAPEGGGACLRVSFFCEEGKSWTR